jgi:hypothetical protein
MGDSARRTRILWTADETDTCNLRDLFLDSACRQLCHIANLLLCLVLCQPLSAPLLGIGIFILLDSLSGIGILFAASFAIISILSWVFSLGQHPHIVLWHLAIRCLSFMYIGNCGSALCHYVHFRWGVRISMIAASRQPVHAILFAAVGFANTSANKCV